MSKRAANPTVHKRVLKEPAAPGVLSLWSGKFEDWLHRYSLWLEIAILVAGAALRVAAAAGTYLNPDEALHFDIANQSNPLAVYRVSLANAHPPLYFLLLYFWQLVGNSEMFLRLPAILAGTALIFVMGRWLANVAGRAAGLAAMLMIAFSPPLIFLGSEVRGYSLLLLFMAAALYCLERGLSLNSVPWMTRFSIFLGLAVLTHYSAVWFTIALGVYVLLRMRELSRRTLVQWGGFQIGVALLYVFLYVTHISHLQGGGMEKEAAEGWLRSSYYQSGVDSPVEFFTRGTSFLFQFLFAQRTAGQIALALFVASLVGLGIAGVRRRMASAHPLSFATLLALPFLLTGFAAGWRLYPYGGTRHDAYLIIFAIAGVSLSVAAIAGRRSWLVLILAAVILPIWSDWADPMPQSLPIQSQRIGLMREAVAHIHSSVPPGSMIFIDTQSSTLVGYYLCRNEVMTATPGKGGFQEAACGTYRFIISPQWMLDVNAFMEQISRIHAAYGLTAQEQLWVFNAGWGILNLLAQISPEILGPTQIPKGFGTSISVFQAVDVPAPEPELDVPPIVLRVNAGGNSFTDSNGRQWAADTDYTGGAPLRSPGAVAGTFVSPLYEDERQGTSPFRYEFKVPNHEYRVILRFAEISDETRGQETFNVALNHVAVLTNFDIAAEAKGERKAVDREFVARVTNRRLLIEFTPVRGSAAINAIEVIPK